MKRGTKPLPPPRPTGRVHAVNLTGYLVPWDRGRDQPVCLSMPASDYDYIACFSDKKRLEETLAFGSVAYEGIKQITDGAEFLESVSRPPYCVIVNPYWDPVRGTVRFLQLYPEVHRAVTS